MKPRASPEVLVARSREGNAKMLEMLSRRRVRAAALETIRLEDPEDWSQVDEALNGIDAYDWVAFTSPRAVATFKKRLDSLSLSQGDLKPRFAAVGPKTAETLRRMGVEVDFVPEDYLTSALGGGLPIGHGSRVLLLRADIGDKSLVATLRGRGFEVDDVALYRTSYVGGPVDRGLISRVAVVVFASPSEVEGFRRRLGRDFGEVAHRAAAACIGPVTARAAEEAGFKSVDFATAHTAEALASMVEEMLVHA